MLYENIIKSSKRNKNKNQWEVIDLYQIFRFQKGKSSKEYISFHDSLKEEFITDDKIELIK